MRWLIILAALASGCISVTHPARVSPGFSMSLTGLVERLPEDGFNSESGPYSETVHSTRAQLALGYGRELDDGRALYGGVIIGSQKAGDFFPYLVGDLYLQTSGGPGALDSGVGVLFSYYPTLYVLVGHELGPLRVDAGLNVAFGLDDPRCGADCGRDDAGPLREITPHVLLTLVHLGHWSAAAYGEWALYRNVERAAPLSGEADFSERLEGGFAAGLVVGWGL